MTMWSTCTTGSISGARSWFCGRPDAEARLDCCRGSLPRRRVARQVFGGEFVQIFAPVAALGAAELEEIAPAVNSGGMHVVEPQADGIIADGVDLHDRHGALAPHRLALVRRMALDFRARAENAQELGGKFVGLAIVEGDRERGLALEQPNLGRRDLGMVRCGKVSFGRHRGTPDDVAVQPFQAAPRVTEADDYIIAIQALP